MPIYWPFILFFLWVLVVEVLSLMRITKLNHAIKITIMMQVKDLPEQNTLLRKYQNSAFKDLISPVPNSVPNGILSLLNQRRRSAALRFLLHAVGLVGIVLWLIFY